MGDFKTRTARERTSLSSANPVCFTLWFPCRRFSALPFDPCLMRVLDHQYSNCITWKKKRRRTPLSFPPCFSQCSPRASLMLSFVMHCLACYRLSRSAILVSRSFRNLYLMWFARTTELLLFPPHTGLSTFEAVFLLPFFFFFYYLLVASLLTDSNAAAFTQLIRSSPLIWMRKTYCNCVWMDKKKQLLLFL